MFQDIVRQAREAGLVNDRLRLKDATHMFADAADVQPLQLAAQVRERLLQAALPFFADWVGEQQARIETLRQLTAELPDDERLAARVEHMRQMVAELRERVAQLPPLTEPDRSRERLQKVLEYATGLRTLDLHRQAFEGNSPPSLLFSRDAEALRSGALQAGAAVGNPVFVGKAILFAPTRLLFPVDLLATTTVEPSTRPNFADIPQPGEVIEEGWPILTVLAEASTLEMCRFELQSRARAVYERFPRLGKPLSHEIGLRCGIGLPACRAIRTGRRPVPRNWPAMWDRPSDPLPYPIPKPSASLLASVEPEAVNPTRTRSPCVSMGLRASLSPYKIADHPPPCYNKPFAYGMGTDEYPVLRTTTPTDDRMISPDLAAENEHFSERVRRTLEQYSEPLLRQVVQRMLKPRNQWPTEELIERSAAALTNAAIIDRRLKEILPASRKLLAIVGLSRQPVWRVGHLLAILAVLEHTEGLTPILELVESGLIHPVLASAAPPLKQFEEWLGPSGIATSRLFVHPAVTSRALQEDLGFPAFPTQKLETKTVRANDGLEWLLRTAVAWQRVGTGPVRLTQQQTLFKRDLQRFQTDELLASPFVDQLIEIPDAALLALSLAIAVDLIETDPLEMHSRPAPDLWKHGLLPALVALWKSLFALETWNPISGYQLTEDGGLFPSVTLPAFLILKAVPAGEWIQAETIAEYVFHRHPSWAATLKNKRETAVQWMQSFLMGVCYPLRIVEAVQESALWWFRLGDVGRHILCGDAAPKLENDFRQTLVVQPNGEMVVFRQGLTPDLIGKLTRFGIWKTLGSACTMELTAESVYHGLETGLNSLEIQRLLEQHGTRAIPATVLDSLQRWANKRDRITVFSSATLLEFTSPEDLEAAFSRGLVSLRLTSRIGLASGGEEIDYKHFRLIGNRDYEARPQKCLTFDADGVTFSVDTAQSDLLLEAELSRLAEPLPDSAAGQRRFALTPASLKKAQSQGTTLGELEQWVLDRSGEGISDAIRLLYCGSGGVPGHYRQRLVVQLPSETVADGVAQWPATGNLIEERLGSCSIAVSGENLRPLIEQLRGIGIELILQETPR